MPSYNSTARMPFAKGGRTGFSSGSKKKETRKDKKKRKRKELSQQVSRETFHEAVRDLRSTKGKVHSIKRGQDTQKIQLKE